MNSGYISISAVSINIHIFSTAPKGALNPRKLRAAWRQFSGPLVTCAADLKLQTATIEWQSQLAVPETLREYPYANHGAGI